MCLYPIRLRNRKYAPTKKNGGVVPSLPVIAKNLDYELVVRNGEYKWIKKSQVIYDDRVAEILAPCGRCIECCEAKAREWQVRLTEEIKDWKHMYFVTFTFSPKELREIMIDNKIGECNAAAGYALRHSLELYRKYNKKSYRHWFITELGHKKTERIHMHGIIFMDKAQEFKKIREVPGKGWMCEWKYWKYGHIFVGDYVNQRSINYVVKYMNKIDNDHKQFVGQVFASPGIGRRWIEHLIEIGDTTYTYRPKETKDFYRLNNGCKVKLPKYYSNKLLSEDERELKWRDFLDTEKESIRGVTYDKRTLSRRTIDKVRDKAGEVNMLIGYGNGSGEWKKRPYNITRRMITKAEKDPEHNVEFTINLKKFAKKSQENLEI